MTTPAVQWLDSPATDATPAGEAGVRRRSTEPIALVDLLDRLLGTGVVLSGDIVISLSGIDLVQVQLHALVTSVRAEMVPDHD